jgi:hypothetical protein
MSENGEKKCTKCGGWWPKSYLIEGLCWNCDGRYEEYKKQMPRLRGFKADGDYPGDDALMWRLFDEGKEIAEIAVAMHVSSETIRRWLQIEEYAPAQPTGSE